VKRFTHALRCHARVLAALALFTCLSVLADQPTSRTPAPVMTFHGADWLERPEREQEEQPDEVIKTMGLKPGDIVADIGCGTGYFSRRMAKAVAPGGKVYANEIQPEFIEMLKANCAKEGIVNVEPVLGAEDDPKLPIGGIDWILLTDVYHEFQQPQPMLAKMLESLKPDGKVALIEYRLLGDTAKHIKEEHRMSVKQVLAEWNKAGFELVDLLEFLPSQHFFIFQRDPDRVSPKKN
jgi:predicted methyltransferase